MNSSLSLVCLCSPTTTDLAFIDKVYANVPQYVLIPSVPHPARNLQIDCCARVSGPIRIHFVIRLIRFL